MTEPNPKFALKLPMPTNDRKLGNHGDNRSGERSQGITNFTEAPLCKSTEVETWENPTLKTEYFVAHNVGNQPRRYGVGCIDLLGLATGPAYESC